VHVLVDNTAQREIADVRLALAGLSPEFAVTPSEQHLESLGVGEEDLERLFTVRVPEDYAGDIQFAAVATVGTAATRSGAVVLTVVPHTPLTVHASANRTAVRAGESVYIDASVQNGGTATAEQVTVRLVDVAGHLGTLFYSVGDIPPGDRHDTVFTVQVPAGIPGDAQSLLVAQAVSEDGTSSEAEPLPLSIACIPRLEIGVESLGGTMRPGQSIVLTVLVRNVGTCAARDVTVGLAGLPDADLPPPRQIPSLSPGDDLRADLVLAIPNRYAPGVLTLSAQAHDHLGVTTESAPLSLTLSGLPTWFTLLFALLGMLAVGATIFGLASYFRRAAHR
jgi:uncharacterized membrane protein